jgi:hypothetical protein
VSRIPREAREGLLGAWLEILHERHPGVTWLPLEDGSVNDDEGTNEAAASQEVATPTLVQ